MCSGLNGVGTGEGGKKRDRIKPAVNPPVRRCWRERPLYILAESRFSRLNPIPAALRPRLSISPAERNDRAFPSVSRSLSSPIREENRRHGRAAAPRLSRARVLASEIESESSLCESARTRARASVDCSDRGCTLKIFLLAPVSRRLRVALSILLAR